jgi:hypothetical protein
MSSNMLCTPCPTFISLHMNVIWYSVIRKIDDVCRRKRGHNVPYGLYTILDPRLTMYRVPACPFTSMLTILQCTSAVSISWPMPTGRCTHHRHHPLKHSTRLTLATRGFPAPLQEQHSNVLQQAVYCYQLSVQALSCQCPESALL